MKHLVIVACVAAAVASVPAFATYQGVLGLIEVNAEAKAESFDYASCRLIVEDMNATTDSLMTDWKELTQTPEGRWCVR